MSNVTFRACLRRVAIGIRKAVGRLSANAWSFVRHPEWWTATLTACGVFLGGLSMYVEHVYQREHLRVSIIEFSLVGGQIRVLASLQNQGTSQVVVLRGTPAVEFEAGLYTRNYHSAPPPLVGSTHLPLVIDPGRVAMYEVTVPLDVATLWTTKTPKRQRDGTLSVDVYFDVTAQAVSAMVSWNALTFVTLTKSPNGRVSDSSEGHVWAMDVFDRVLWLGYLQ